MGYNQHESLPDCWCPSLAIRVGLLGPDLVRDQMLLSLLDCSVFRSTYTFPRFDAVLASPVIRTGAIPIP